MKKFISLFTVKKICFLLSVVLALSVLSACRSAGAPIPATNAEDPQPSFTSVPQTTTLPIQPTTAPTQPTTMPTQPTVPAIELMGDVAYSTYNMLKVPESAMKPLVIKSSTQLQQEMLAWQAVNHTFNEYFLKDLAELFPDEFFENNTLIVLCFTARPGYYSVIVEECVQNADGTYTLVVTEAKPTFNDEMKNYVYVFLRIYADIPQDAVIDVQLVNSEHMIYIEDYLASIK